MSFREMYQSELSALRQHAAELCERQKSLNAILNPGARDPDVERLMQGASFLTARLRQRISDDFPEITQGLIQRLSSNYLRPMPSLSIVQFDPGPEHFVPRHCEVISTPIDGVQCRFRSAFETQVLPLELHRLEHAAGGKSAALTLGLMLPTKGHLGELNLKSLRLHLAGASSISCPLYLGLTRHLHTIRLTLLAADAEPLIDKTGTPAQITIEPSCVKPVGFDDDQALLDHAASHQKGYRLLQEFFVFKEKFLFVDVTGLQAIKRLDEDLVKQACGFEMRFELGQCPRQGQHPTLENIKLYCTPVINLFAHQAFPIKLEAQPLDYPLVPANMPAHCCELYSVDKVTGWTAALGHHRLYTPARADKQASEVPFAHYSLNQQPSMLDARVITTIRLSADDLAQEVVSIDLTCTNGNLPQRLAIGDICQRGPKVSGQLTFKNICPATAAYAPVLEGGQLWQLISNLSLNYLSLENVKALAEILRTYDLPALQDTQSRLASDRLFAALTKVSHKNIDFLKRGQPIRGTRTVLEIDPEDAECEAQWFLFGGVLQHFFALYASNHSFNQLHIKSTSGAVWSWAPGPGQQKTF